MNRERIEETVRLWQAEPDKAKGKPAVIARAEGSKAVMEHGSFSWRTDMPVPLGGTTEAPSPTALLLSALAGCAVVFIRDTLAPQLGVTVDAIEAQVLAVESVWRPRQIPHPCASLHWSATYRPVECRPRLWRGHRYQDALARFLAERVLNFHCLVSRKAQLINHGHLAYQDALTVSLHVLRKAGGRQRTANPFALDTLQGRSSHELSSCRG
jgi:uncharacterized OsmC-like protein